MKKLIPIAFLGLVISSCVTSTPYSAANQYGQGLQITKEDRVRMSSFKGNTSTSSSNAYLFATLGAMEDCAKESNYVFMTKPLDQSHSVTYTQVNSSTTYLSNSNGTKTPLTNVYSYPVTETIPKFQVAYMCLKNFKELENKKIQTEVISKELVSPITKDFAGGIMMKFDEANNTTALKNRDILIRFNNTRVESLMDYSKAFENSPVGTVKVQVIRDQKIKNLTLKVIDSTIVLHNLSVDLYQIVCGHVSKSNTDFGQVNEDSQDVMACKTIRSFIESKQHLLSAAKF